MSSCCFKEISKQDVETYETQGYLLIRSFWSKEKAESLLASIQELESKVERVKSPFKSQKKNSARDLIESAHKVVGFSAGKKSPIQQIGHCLHRLVPEFEKASHSEEVWNLCKALGVRNPRIVQSKAVLKPKHHGWRVPVHSDEQFIYTNPLSGFGLWWALDSCTKENGCLEVLPGSHKTFYMPQRFECDHKELKTGFKPFVREPGEESKLPSAYTSDEAKVEKIGMNGGQGPTLEAARLKRIPWSKHMEAQNRGRWQRLEMDPGDLVVLHPYILHSSSANRSEKSRRAYTIHLVDGSLPWSLKNWIQPKEGDELAPFPQQNTFHPESSDAEATERS
mmetsp:Transcript_9454/g.13180  ORF Transcript_9454/g.13180 Transcript_9454/m.13180 type:complete len:337 (-) Transcript_9454:123-1133(-)